jgi:hypothetical protein
MTQDTSPVTCAGRRVAGDGQLGEHLAGRHDGADPGRRCGGSLQPAPVAPVRDPAALVARWNALCPTGTKVAIALEGVFVATTASIAWVDGEGNACVILEERDWPVRVEALRPLNEGEQLPPLANAPARAVRSPRAST